MASTVCNPNDWQNAIVRGGGVFENGVLRFPDTVNDENVNVYRAMGGARMTERSHVPFAMTSLDTPTLHRFLADVAPASRDAVIIDVGGGDGRNALPWLEWGYRRIIVVDAAGEALMRLRSRIAQRHPEWIERVLLIEADARQLPLENGCAQTVIAIETLYYLDDDYEVGLRECARTLASGGRLLISERDREGALLMQLLYGDVEAMLTSYRDGTVRDGPGRSHRTRSFTERELLDMLTRCGLEITSVAGTSLLALMLGWMSGRGLVSEPDSERVAAVQSMLADLARTGRMRRCHVAIATHAAMAKSADHDVRATPSDRELVP